MFLDAKVIDDVNGGLNVIIELAGQEIHSPRGLARFAFVWGKRCVPSRLLLLILRPMESKLSALTSDPRYQLMADECVAAGHKNNLWLQRTPLSPRTKVVRYSDYTSLPILHKSSFYQNILSQAQIEYGAAVTVWKQQTWLASLRFLRTRKQGDFTNAEINYLRHWQPTFAHEVIGLAQRQEDRLKRKMLEKFIGSLPTAFVLLDWNLQVQFHNFAAVDICNWWKHGTRALFMKVPATLSVPNDILTAIRQMQRHLQEGTVRPSSSSTNLLSPHAESAQNLYAHIQYEPSSSLTLSRGFFHLYWRREMVSNVHGDIYGKLKRLTSRERECVKLLSSGKAPRQIARTLGTSRNTVRNQLSSIYQKLGFSGQVELTAFFARNPDAIAGEP